MDRPERSAPAAFWRRHGRSFPTIMVMHLVFPPYDAVNYLAGLLRIRWRPFVLATALGSIPGTLAITLFGSSFTGSLADSGAMQFDPRVFGASAARRAPAGALTHGGTMRDLTTPARPGQPFWRRNGRKLGALLFWAALIGGYQVYAWRNGLSPLAAADRLVGALRTGAGPLIYVGVYLLRPLILFPATVLTIAGGFVFGPLLGVIYTIIGSNGSALLAYAVGRFFGAGAFEPSGGALAGYVERMRRNSFATIMTMRLIFLPYDLVNYLAGLLKIDWKAFLLATALGSIPGTLAIVLFGSSFTGSLADIGALKFDPRVFGASAAIFAASIAISRYVKRREAGGQAAPIDTASGPPDPSAAHGEERGAHDRP